MAFIRAVGCPKMATTNVSAPSDPRSGVRTVHLSNFSPDVGLQTVEAADQRLHPQAPRRTQGARGLHARLRGFLHACPLNDMPTVAASDAIGVEGESGRVGVAGRATGWEKGRVIIIKIKHISYLARRSR